MSKQGITVIDAVMGTGKSTWIIEQIIAHPGEKYVVVVPLLTEVERYRDKLAEHRATFAPESIGKQTTKAEAFKSMLAEGTGVIITTHSLFSSWDAECFTHIAKHGYHGVLDETVALVEETDISEHDYQMLLSSGYIEEHAIDGKDNLIAITDTARTPEYVGQFNKFVRHAQRNNLVKVNGAMYIRTIKPESLTSFKSCFVLTYMFPGSEMDCWLRLYGLEASLKTLKEDEITGTRTLVDHLGEYSGMEFLDLITLVDTPTMNAVGRKGRKQGTPLSNEWFHKATAGEQKQLQNNLANMAHHMTRRFARDVIGDTTSHHGYYFMWSAKLEIREAMEKKLPYRRIPTKALSPFGDNHKERDTDREIFVAYNQRATNDYAHKGCLAYLTAPFLRVPISNFFAACGLKFDGTLFMLSTLLQWVWRSRIRRREEI